jgi:hypothetical protein
MERVRVEQARRQVIQRQRPESAHRWQLAGSESHAAAVLDASTSSKTAGPYLILLDFEACSAQYALDR